MIFAPCLALLLTAAPAPDTAVVCPVEFQTALRPWVEHRASQGHAFQWLSNRQSPEELRTQIRALAKTGLRTVLLVGDADPALQVSPAVRARCVPTQHVPAKVNVRWGSEPQIASDNWYADTDDDQVPDLAIGRLTADSPDELSEIVRKILAYEQDAAGGAWRRRVNFIAGLGGFGRLADAALEVATKKLITDGIPAGYSTSMTYASWHSPYCPDPRGFCQTTVNRLNEGCLFWVYIGHGQKRFVDWLHVPGGGFPILTDRDIPRLACQQGAPIACFLACYTAAFDQTDDCLAEEMLRAPGGPVAVLGGTRVTMPYAMSVLGTEMLKACFERGVPTLGQAFLEAKRNMMRDSRDGNRASLDALAALISPAPVDLRAERAEHLELFHLIGDPLLRIVYPQQINLQTAATATAGETMKVEGAAPFDGAGRVELIVRRDRLTFEAQPREQFLPTATAMAAYQPIYEKANDPVLVSLPIDLRQGRFTAELKVPRDAHGPCHVRASLDSSTGHALGSADVQITAAK